MLTNTSFDKTGTFECVVKNTKEFFIIDQNGDFQSVKQVQSNTESKIIIDNIDGWNYILLTNKK